MYARMVTVHAQAGKLDEIVKIYRESVIPAAKQQKGFKGARLFIDRANNKGVSITRWASEADLKAGEDGGFYQEQIAKLAPMLAGAPVREIFEIGAEDSGA